MSTLKILFLYLYLHKLATALILGANRLSYHSLEMKQEIHQGTRQTPADRCSRHVSFLFSASNRRERQRDSVHFVRISLRRPFRTKPSFPHKPFPTKLSAQLRKNNIVPGVKQCHNRHPNGFFSKNRQRCRG